VKLHQISPASDTQRSRRNTWWLWLSGLVLLLFAGSELVALLMNQSSHLWALLAVFIGVPLAFYFLSQGRPAASGGTLIITIGLQAILIPLAQRGSAVPISITSLALMSGISLTAFPRRYAGRVLLAGLIFSIASILIDLFGSSSRLVADLGQGRWIFSFIILTLFVISFAREFLFLDLRTKIVIGILAMGGMAVVMLVIFALQQAGQITSALAERLDVSVNDLAEEQLINTARTEANRANQEFEDIAEEVTQLAQTWVSLRSQEGALDSAAYWDARNRLVQMEEGQYGNAATDISSVFVPVGTQVDDALIADLNVSAYLDFSAPAILEDHASMVALYAIDTKGITRYYPNVELASILPPDFDATKRPHFSISTPLFNPQRIPRWTIPYVDATGAGLVVTVAAPVYENNQFIGIVAADMQLAQITKQIGAIRVGETGYAYMLDDAGRILSMPQAGFDMFGIRPEDISNTEFYKHTVLGVGTDELRSLTNRMVAGGDGLLIVNVAGVNSYVSFSPVKANDYSIALVVPVSELQLTIAAARGETQRQIQTATRLAAILLIALLVFAIAVSLGLGSVIAAPIQRLTKVASQIAAGDLRVQASATTSDEIGTLAHAFNTMTSRLRESLDELEKRVEERTAELVAANERNERRARQFEAIADIARTISSTRDLDMLLSQITTVINREFGFYHVGIFLLDTAKEYAVLSAANSEGGKRMLERGHRLKVGETGLVGYVTGTGTPRVALDTGMDAVYFDNPDLPETHSELTLPLRVGEEIIGALDVQSTEPNAFGQEDINILSTLADQVSIAIQNAQQFEQTRKALSEAELLSRQFVQTGWKEFTKNRNLLGIHHTGARASLIYKRNGKDKEDDLLAANQPRTNRRGASLSLPIKLHGEVIGSVDVHTPDNRPWDQDELDIVTAILERAAIALENARLLAQSQKRAAKERIIGEISSKISMQSEINELLKTAAQELGRSLPGAEIAIQFNKDTE
jgi:GAF domain-containing protein/HAMP domain-containing protein